jgi:hypothetical protein
VVIRVVLKPFLLFIEAIIMAHRVNITLSKKEYAILKEIADNQMDKPTTMAAKIIKRKIRNFQT